MLTLANSRRPEIGVHGTALCACAFIVAVTFTDDDMAEARGKKRKLDDDSQREIDYLQRLLDQKDLVIKEKEERRKEGVQEEM